MLRWLLAALRCLYLSLAALLMLTGLLGLTGVREVTGTLLGGGPTDLFSAYAAGTALLLLGAGVLCRMRGAQWLMGSLLLLGGALSAHSLATYPSEADDPAASLVFSPAPGQLVGTAVAFTGLFLVVTLSSPRSRRRLRVMLGSRGRDAPMHWAFRRSYLALAAFLLLAGWASKLHMHRLIHLTDVPISSLESWVFNMTALGLTMFGLALAFRCRSARRFFSAALLGGLALSAFSLLALPLSVEGAPIAFAPTPGELNAILMQGTALLLLVVLSAPQCRQAWRHWMQRFGRPRAG